LAYQRTRSALSGQALAALGATVGQDLAAAHGRHAGAESVTMLADQLRGLIGALHDDSPKNQRHGDLMSRA
jgi:hypothetical protein